MSDDNFIARWSRLKREAEDEKRPKQPAPSTTTPEQPPAAAAPSDTHPDTEPPFDPATLPPIESIVADTDIRAFLQKGVPAELTKAALRRAWSADPAIRDFIEIAENQWDFTDPSSIPGFGAMQASDDVRQLVSQAMGQLTTPQPTVGIGEGQEEGRAPAPEIAQEIRPAPTAAEAATAPSESDKPEAQSAPAAAASRHPEPTSDSSRTARRKGRGAAMPR